MKYIIKNNLENIRALKKESNLVLIFEEQTPRNLIKEILPDILVKGGDYKIEEIVGSNIVIRNGGKVEILQFHEGYSSSNYIGKIKTLT